MDIGLAAALTAIAREGDDRRYDGCEMWSALPTAPVLHDRATFRAVAARGQGPPSQ